MAGDEATTLFGAVHEVGQPTENKLVEQSLGDREVHEAGKASLVPAPASRRKRS
jgi:hypothetical protein